MPRAGPGWQAEITRTRSGFPKRLRLSNSAQFGAVFAHGKRTRTSVFLALVRPNGRDEPRLGLAVSKRKIPLAVHRNKIKRLIRESFRQNRVSLGGLDIVVVPSARAGSASGEEIRTSLEVLWNARNTQEQPR